MQDYFFKDVNAKVEMDMIDQLSDDSNDSDNVKQNQEKDEKKTKAKLLLHPDSVVRMVWDITLFVAIVYQGISLPMRIAFEISTDDFTFILEFVLDCVFMFDVFLNFNTSIYQANTIITNRQEIALDYIKFWFWIDLVSSIPYTWIFAWSQGLTLRMIESDDAMDKLGLDSNLANAPQLLRLLKIAKLMKMLKLLRVMKLKKLMGKFDEYIVSDSMDLMVTFVNLTIKILIIAHYMSCIFFYVGITEY